MMMKRRMGNKLAGRVRWAGLLLALACWLLPALTAPAADTLASLSWQHLSVQRQGLADDTIQALAAGQNVAYIGTRRGLNIYTPATRALRVLRRADGLPHDNVQALLVYGGRVAVGTERGLALIAPGEKRVAPENVLARALDIRGLTVDEGWLFLATPGGVYRWQAGKPAPEKVPGLSNLSATGLTSAQRGLLITLTDGSLRLWDRKTRAVTKVPLEMNDLRNPVQAAAAGGDWLWFATRGSGLIGHDFMQQEWISLGDQPEIGGYLTSLAADGRFIWFGTFSGLFRYDTVQRKGLSTKLQALTDKDLTCLAVGGQRLWVGTAGDGVFFADKRTPQISLRPLARYVGKEVLSLSGTVQGRAPLTPRLEYRRAGDRRWSTKHATVKREGGRLTGRLDFRKLPDGRYRCRLSVRDAGRRSNALIFRVVKETKAADLTFPYHTLRAGRNRLTGEYSPAAAQAIVLTPGNASATLNPQEQTYTAELDLSPRDRWIGFKVKDRSGQSKSFRFRVTVLPAPEVSVKAAPRLFVPGFEKVRFTPRAQNVGDLARWAVEITDQQGSVVFRHEADEALPETFAWDGLDADDQLVKPDRLFFYSFTLQEKNGFSLTTPKKALKSQRPPPDKKPRVAKTLTRTFMFDTGEALIKNEDLDFFPEIKRLAQKHPNSMLLLEGHTDSQPINTSDYRSNQELSEARAAQVARHLQRKFGLTEKRILTVGYGSHYPVASNEDPVARRQNRRVEITIVGR